MLLPLVVALLQIPTTPVSDGPASRDARPVRVWLGAGGLLARGTPVRVYVQAAQDGNLLVLHRRTDGRIDVLFPGSPKDDPYVRAGTYEIQATPARVAFVVSEPDGDGLVLAALAPTAYRFDSFVRNAAWSPDALAPSWDGSDGEGVLSDIVQRMLGDGYFNYDIAAYTVAPPAYAMAPDTSAAYPAYPTCTDCTFIGVQENVFEPLALCDAFVSPCGTGRRFHHGRPGGDPVVAPRSAIALSMRGSLSASPIPRSGRPGGGASARPRARAAEMPRARTDAPWRALPLAPGRRAVAHAPAAPPVPVRRRMIDAPAEAAPAGAVELALTGAAPPAEPDRTSRYSGTITLTGLTVTPPARLAAAADGRAGGVAPRALSQPAPRARAFAVASAGAAAGRGTGETGGAAAGPAGSRGQGIALPPAAFHGVQARIPAGRTGARRR